MAAAVLAAVVVVGAVTFGGSNDAPPSAVAGVQQNTPAQAAPAPATPEPPASEEPPGEEVDLFDPIRLKLPFGYNLDRIGVFLSTKEGEQQEPTAKTPEEKASNILGTKFSKSPYVFSVIVGGAGETMSKGGGDIFSEAAGSTYQFAFFVNHDGSTNQYYDDGFEVRVQWNTLAKQYTGVARDKLGRVIANDSNIMIEWLDPSTLEVIVDVPGLDVAVAEVRTELVANAIDENGITIFSSFDVAIWTAEP